MPKLPKPGRLKGNPNLHKERKPLRTIVNGIGTPTEKMAEIAEFQLNEYVEQTPSYIKDTTDFLRKLDEIKMKLPTQSFSVLMWRSYIRQFREMKVYKLAQNR